MVFLNQKTKEMLNYNQITSLSNKNLYNDHEIFKCIIIAKKAKNDRLKQKAKTDLFKGLSFVIVKNIENFFFLCKTYSDIIHTKDDLVSESYIVLEDCINGFDIRLKKKFYWYFNKSLTRAFQRLVEKNYYKHRHSSRILPEIEDIVFKSKSVSNSADFTQIGIDKFNLSDLEKHIIFSRLNEEAPRDYVKNNCVSSDLYNKSLSSIRLKLNFIRT